MIHSLFADFFAAVDATYDAFAFEGDPHLKGRAELYPAAYEAKDARTAALCRLVAALRARGIRGVADGVQAYYRPSPDA